MRRSAREGFDPATEPLEGSLRFMYLDTASPPLVTTGRGNLIDPASLAIDLPWKRPDGSAASRAEILAEWAKVKAMTERAPYGGGSFASVTSLRLPPEAVDALVEYRLQSNEAWMKANRFPDFDEWPADAQLATHSMAWACGAGFRFPRLVKALQERDFEQAALECTINPQRGTIIVRNEANRLMYRAAARVQGMHLDYDVLCLDVSTIKPAVASRYQFPKDPSKWVKPATRFALEQDDVPTLPSPVADAPVLEEDGGAGRRAATLDIVREANEADREPPSE